MGKGKITFDTSSGDLIKDRVWQVLLSTSEILGQLDDMVYANISDESTDDVKGCKMDKRHVTGLTLKKVVLDLFGTTTVYDFVPVSEMPYEVISEAFAARLRSTKLTGYAIRSVVQIGCNQSSARDSEVILSGLYR